MAPDGNVVVFFFRGPYILFKGNTGGYFKALLKAIFGYFEVF